MRMLTTYPNDTIPSTMQYSIRRTDKPEQALAPGPEHSHWG
jgi:hypothetical protein